MKRQDTPAKQEKIQKKVIKKWLKCGSVSNYLGKNKSMGSKRKVKEN